MPIEISIDKENDLILRTVRGLVSTKELLKSIETVLIEIEIFYDMEQAKKWLGT